MTKRTWWFRFLTTLLIFGLAACGGSGGGGGGGGGGTIPTATNSAITPPPTTTVAITTGGATLPANESIAANAFQASSGALSNASTASGLVGAVQADNSGTQANRETLAALVRRHAERLKDHQSSATSAVQVATQPCSGGGTQTFAFDDANLSATEVFVNCNEGGSVFHGTISSSNVGVSQSLGSTIGSPYSITVTATFSIDLSIATAAPASIVVTQGSFTFTAGFSGNMQAAANGGVEPGVPNRVQLSMGGASLLTSNGTVRERLSDFSLSIDKNDTLGRTTTSGGYTYASTIIGGSVTVTVSPLQPIVFQPQGALHPSSGTVTITSPGSPGKIVLTVISVPFAGVRVDVFADANGAVTDTANLTWAQVDAL